MDTVGMRISVPASQEHIALDPSTWPNDMKCRRWEPPGVWHRKHQTENGYRSNAYSSYEGGEERDQSYDREGGYRNSRW